MTTTPNLSLPYLMAAQAQKHVTHNEAIRALDCLVQLSVEDRDLSSPPAAPAEGSRYLVASPAAGAWTGQSGRIAAFQDGAWSFFAPREGWVAWVADEDKLLAWNGTAWVALGGIDPATGLQNVALVGINATADTGNRLALKSDASLFDHAGSGHQLKVNKAASAGTGSLLFQTNYSSRAELGLAGDDKFRLKVSADGASWTDAVVIDNANARVGMNTDAPVAALDVRAPDVAVAQFTNINATGGGAGMVGYTFRLPLTASERLGFLLFGSRNGAASSQLNTTGIEAFTEAAWTSTTSWPTFLRFVTTSAGSVARTERLRIEATGNTRPGQDNTYSLGTAANRWSSIFAANGTINTSDARDKAVAGGLETFAGQMVDAVAPILFRWTNGGNEWVEDGTETVAHPETGELETRPRMVLTAKPGKRLHAGFRAQDVRAAMDAAGVDFGAWGLDAKDDPSSRQWLRTEQLTPVLWEALRETRARLSALEARLAPPGAGKA